MAKQSKGLTSQEVYEEVNRKVLDELSKALTSIEAGKTWQCPWVNRLGNRPRNFQSGKPYRGVNRLLLGFAGYSDPRWTTAPAAFKLKGHIRKGEKSTLVTLWKRIMVKDETAEGGKRVIPILRYFRVFNVEQIDWPEGVLPELPQTDELSNDIDYNAEADSVFGRYVTDYSIPVFHGGNSAHYNPFEHSITLPDDEQFTSAAGYYGTVFHEAAHSTHKECKRELGSAFGSDKYAREELVAEIASALVCEHVGVEGDTVNDAQYIKHWMSRIEADDKLFIQSAGKAQKAADVVLGIKFDEPDSAVSDKELSNITDNEVVAAA